MWFVAGGWSWMSAAAIIMLKYAVHTLSTACVFEAIHFISIYLDTSVRASSVFVCALRMQCRSGMNSTTTARTSHIHTHSPTVFQIGQTITAVWRKCRMHDTRNEEGIRPPPAIEKQSHGIYISDVHWIAMHSLLYRAPLRKICSNSNNSQPRHTETRDRI